jgi:hypothetical protein
MKQRAHAWVALRALKLIDDSGKAPRLVELMSYYLSDVWDGAWLPDTLIGDMSYGHIFKLDDSAEFLGYDITKAGHRKLTYAKLKQDLSGTRLCLTYAKDADVLLNPYWKHKDLSGNLPDRVIAIAQSVGDMLKMSDYPMAFYVKKKRSQAYNEDLSGVKVKDLTLSPNFSARQIALGFFLVSHYICDGHMPLHCDLRDYGKAPMRRIPKTLHPSIEEEWEEHFPTKEDITLHDYITCSIDDVVVRKMPKDSIIEIDKKAKYSLSDRPPKMKKNEWDEMVSICRTSFAVSRKWINDSYKKADDMPEPEFKEVTNFIFHDAVESVARVWLKIWERFTT